MALAWYTSAGANIAALPEARIFAAAAAAPDGRYVHILGGQTAAETYDTKHYRYDRVTQTYETLLALPRGSYSGSAAWHDGRLYYAEGVWTGSGSPGNQHRMYSRAPDGAWVTYDLPYTPLTASQVGTRILAIGDDLWCLQQNKSAFAAHLWTGSGWSTRATAPWAQNIVDSGVVNVNGVAYLVGGYNATVGGTNAVSGTYTFDAGANSWSDSATSGAPASRRGPAVGVFDGVLYAFGGASVTGAPVQTLDSLTVSSGVWRADSDSDPLTPPGAPPAAYALRGAAVAFDPVSGIVWAFGGSDNVSPDNERSFVLALSAGIPDAPLSPDAVAADAGDRLRSSVSETTGSLLEAVDARAVDASVSEAYTYAQELAGTSLRTFREVLRERDSVTADFAYYPQPRQNIVMENQYTGISVLSRLARYYPPRIFDDVVNLGIAVIPAATATDIIDYVLTQWAAANDWLTFEPVPDLRVPMPGLKPSDYGVGTGQVYAATVTIRQDGTNRQDALSILRDLLSPFPGTVVRQNSTGKLEIVPASGPDADETPHVTLTTDDLYSVTIGKPNPFDVINRCIVTSSGGLKQGTDVAVMQPAWFQIGSVYQFGRSNWFTPPGARQNLQPFDDPTDTTLQEGLSFTSPSSLQKPALWPVSGDAIPAGDGISLVDSGATEMVTMGWARYFEDSLVDSGTSGLTLVNDFIPFDGDWLTVFRVDIALPLDDAYLTIEARWNETQQGVEFRVDESATKLETNCISGCNGVIIEFTLDDASVGYTEGTSVSGTFGFVGDDDTTLPADSVSGDAVLDSQSALGIVERTINIKGYAFDAVTLSQIARGYVIQNITPKVTRELDVSALSGYRVLFDDIGRLIQLPSGDVGFLTGVSYTDDFVSRTVRKTATVEVRDLAAAGAIDTTTLYHIHEFGAYWTTEETGLPIAREEQP